jgi:hypothetical protein
MGQNCISRELSERASERVGLRENMTLDLITKRKKNGDLYLKISACDSEIDERMIHQRQAANPRGSSSTKKI